MAETHEQDYLSIGEVLGLLLEEFPDVTISKIRFLESQGLIDPERTPSGYRKFYDADIELLRVILREQRENYLPLRVIKDRIETGVIDPSGELGKPRTTTDDADISSVVGSSNSTDARSDLPSVGAMPTTALPSIGSEPLVAAPVETADPGSTNGPEPSHPDIESHERPDGTTGDSTPVEAPRLLPGVLLDRSDLCALVGLTASEFDDLERYGVITGRGSGAGAVYGDDAAAVASVAVEMLRAGIDARHLRSFRTAADREVSLYEQLITPRLRQRNPAARAEALEELRSLEELGGRLRAAMTRAALHHHLDA